MWRVARFGISHYLAFVWSFERMPMHANALFYFHIVFYPFAWVSMAFERVYQLSNISMPLKRLNTSNPMTLLPDFILSWELQCNVIFHCITSCTLEHLYLQCSSMFSLVCYVFYLLFTISCYGFYYFLLSFLVMPQISNTVSLLNSRRTFNFWV